MPPSVAIAAAIYDGGGENWLGWWVLCAWVMGITGGSSNGSLVCGDDDLLLTCFASRWAMLIIDVGSFISLF